MANRLCFVLAICLAGSLHFKASAQSLGVNTTGAAADASAILDVSSTAKGVLVPRMNKTQKNSIATPATGLLVYQTLPDSAGFHYYDGTKWIWLSATSDTLAWKITGNSNITSSRFLGTTNDTALRFRVKNVASGIIDSATANTSFGYKTMPSYTSGTGNAAVGYMSGRNLTTGYYNNLFGRFSLASTGVSTGNIAIGDSAMGVGISAHSNIAIGNNALKSFNGQGYYTYNIAIGTESQGAVTGATVPGLSVYNTSVGGFSLAKNVSGNYNTALGISALNSADSSSSNTAIGSDAMYKHRGTGSSNTAVGAFSLRGDSTGYWNTAIGSEAMDRLGFDGTSRGTGYSNVAVGFRALRQVRQGWENTAVGTGALEFDSSGSYNTAVGRYSSFNNKRGDLNTSVGMQAAFSNDTAALTTFIGYNSGFYNKSDFNTGVGSYSLTYNNFTSGTSDQGMENTGLGYGAGYLVNLGSKNTAVGHQSMRGVSNYVSGNRNVAVGDSALTYITSGSDNVAVGANALVRNTNAYSNVAVGGNAMHSNTTAVRNVAVGDSAMYTFSYSSGNYTSDNTAIGSKAMFYNQPVSTATGVKNTAVGSEAMYLNTIGQGNTAMGVSALRENTSGSANTAVGRSAHRLSGTGSFNSYFGYTAGYGDSTGNYNVAMGHEAAVSNDTASAVVALGSQALWYNKADSNVAVGYRAGFFANANPSYQSREQTFLGTYAGLGSYASSKNTAVGFRALAQTTAAGSTSDYPTGGRNTVVGDSVMAGAWGAFNVGIGAQVLSVAGASTHRNVAIGDSAMGNASAPDANVAVGYKSLSQIANQGNTAVGAYSLQNGKNTIWNTALGFHALETDTTGSENTVVGTSAFRYNPNGIRNVSLGINTGFWSTSSNNTYIGSYAGEGTSGLSTGGSNAALGDFALQDITSGSQNTALGSSALTLNTQGIGNTALGYAAGNANTTGTLNTLLGYNSDVSTAALTNATAVGASSYAAQNNSVVLGAISGINGAGTTASVGIGTNTPSGRLHVRRNGASGGSFITNPTLILEDNTNSFIHLSNPTANENGILSGNALTTIRSGIVFGNDSTVLLRAGGNTNRMIIDNNGYVGVGTTAIYPLTQFHLYEPLASNVNMRVASQGANYEPGLELVKTGTGGTDWKVRVTTGGSLVYSRSVDDFVTPTDEYSMSNSSFNPITDNSNALGLPGNKWTTVYATNGTINTSDGREKENIVDLNYGLNEVMKLRPVSFTWKENPQWGKKIGFIAQEVQPVLSEVVQVGELKSKTQEKNDEGISSTKASDRLGVYYSDIIPVAVKAIQEQQKIIEELKKKNQELENDLKLIKAQLGIKN